MVKRVDVAVYEVLRDHSRGTFISGVRQFGLAEGFVDIAYSGGSIDDIREQMEDLRAKIIAGDVVVPPKPAEDRAPGAARTDTTPGSWTQGEPNP
jgi:basic membrane protein A